MPTRRQLAIAIRALSMDAVQQANSGNPGMPMGMADIAQVLWADHLKHNPSNGQANKRIWWMPRRQEAMKDVIACEKPRGAGK